MPVDLPLYKSEPGSKRPRLNKRIILALLVSAACGLYLLGIRAERSSVVEQQIQPVQVPEETKTDAWTPTDIFEEDIVDVDNNEDTLEHDPTQQPSDDESSPAETDALPGLVAEESTAAKEPSINDSKYYRHIVVIASDAKYRERRTLLREHYFGLRDNLRPCMEFNSDTYYAFWIYGELPKSNTPQRRAYEAEKMEWNDMVEMPAGTAFEQFSVLDWVNTELVSRQGISYDYLVVQDIHTFIQLSTVLQELDNKVIGLNTASPFAIPTEKPTSIVWGSFGDQLADKHAFVIGSAAVAFALETQESIQQNNGMTQSPNLLTNLYNYYSQDDTADLADEDTAPAFVREDPVEGIRRFVRWANNVEAVNAADNVVVSHVYQDEELTDLARWTKLQPVSVCHLPKRDEQNASPGSVAIVTSSYIYNYCMEPSATLAANNKRDYALRHGYSFVARSGEFAQQAIRNDRRPVWGKIDVVEKVLPKYDWLFWIDMDAVIMNQNQTLESLFDTLRHQFPDGAAAFDKNIDLIIARPVRDPMINAGVFLIRNTPWSVQFLRDLQGIAQWYKKGPSYEQGAMWDLIQTPENSAKTFLLDRDDHTFNTFPRLYKSGDFIAHFAPDKCPNAATLKGLAAADKIKAGHTITSLDNE